MKSNSKFDYKLTSVENIDRASEEQLLRTYNQDFYTTLSTAKILNLPTVPHNKLLYNFQQNENASVSTTTGQLIV